MGRLKNKPRMQALSRRTFLQAGGIMIAIPFLDAMIPTFSFAQAAATKRFITTLQGSVVGAPAFSIPAAGPLVTLPASWAPLQNLRSDISIISGINLPVYNVGTAPPPGGSQNGQHGFSIGPMLCGVHSTDAMIIPVACKTSTRPGSPTSDQLAIAYTGVGSKFDSIQVKMQAQVYNGQSGVGRNGIMSARKVNGVVLDRPPIVSPLALYNSLFGNTTTPTGPTAPSNLLAKKKSVLDAVLNDAKKLSSSVSGDDKARLELHFDEIRTLEKNIAASTGGTNPTVACTTIANPGPDPALGSLNFGGYSNEKKRGEVQADLIAYAIGCDLTRVASWMLSNDQCFMSSKDISNSATANPQGTTDVHNDSHFATPAIVAANQAFHAGMWARLVQNLKNRTDGNGTILSNTFMSYVTAEGQNAHSRLFVQAVAGMNAKLNLGQHINGNGGHAARVQIAGLQTVGMLTGALGEITTGPIPGLLK